MCHHKLLLILNLVVQSLHSVPDNIEEDCHLFSVDLLGFDGVHQEICDKLRYGPSSKYDGETLNADAHKKSEGQLDINTECLERLLVFKEMGHSSQAHTHDVFDLGVGDENL